ncbi:Bromo_TP domain-containing protein [Cephalotus follicularis]|uniref:Bromo_TP domain-containing protein n=1 Tax=Cephalotus follicularis TaxID=3775 RepID=A0A1Q3BQD6_CEPFO|nr:Bromo_TP domain-containing protein [Cephalotus follicularis]
MALLGEDGRGYELARKLESQGVWRTWLGESTYATFIHSLSSASSWDAFMRPEESKSRAHIQLQLRARALLFDKATVSLFLRSDNNNNNSPLSSSVAVSKLNNNYLQLHGDDVYFTLESNSLQDGGVSSNTAPYKKQPKSAYGGSRIGESEIGNLSQRFRNDELPETWYNQFIEKYRVSRPYRLSFENQESDKRTPEGMSTYLRLLEKQKRRRVTFKDDQYGGLGNPVLESMPNMHGNSVLEGSNLVDDDEPFFPETIFSLNSVPDSALPPVIRAQNKKKVEFYGVLDSLPQVTTRSPVILERLGIRPEYLGMEQGGSLHRGKNGSDGNNKHIGPEQASQISRKVIARMLTNVGFEGATEVPVEVFSQLLSCHICKLGRILKVLADSYRKQCSAVELLNMFLQTVGYSNVGVLAELVKDGTRMFLQQTQQPVHGIQSQQTAIRLPQQIPRQVHPQMQQMLHSQVAFQQQQPQLDRMRRRNPSTPRSVTENDKDRPLVQVKIENPSELPMDGNAFSTINTRHPQMQFRQQQQPIAAMSNFHAQASNQFRQLSSLQAPQMQTQNMAIARPPPVKVEGFQELMGGDSTLKHDSEENKLIPPLNK